MKVARILLVLSLVLVPVVVEGATFVVRDDDNLVRSAKAIVTGSVIEIYYRQGDRLIETVTRILVDEALKGDVTTGTIVDIVQFGGRLDGRILVQSGAPQYEVGNRYLVFLDKDNDGRWTTFDLVIGQFEFRFREGRELVAREDAEIGGWFESGEEFVNEHRLARPFLEYVRNVLRGESPAADYFVNGELARTRSRAASRPDGFTISALPYDLRQNTKDAVDIWKNDPQSTMNDTVSTTPATDNHVPRPPAAPDCEMKVVPDDPEGIVTGSCCPGVIATAFYGCGSPCGTCAAHTFNSESFRTIDYADVVTNNGITTMNLSEGQFLSTMVHEIGHTWSFRHSNQGTPSTTNAIMNSSVVISGGTLQDWDMDAANELYGDGSREASFSGSDYATSFDFGGAIGTVPVRRTSSFSWRIFDAACTGPSISSHPSSTTIIQGNSTTLSVTASASEGALSYQWYRGTKPTKTDPVGTNSSSYNTGVLAEGSHPFWVEVSDTCSGGSPAQSNTATVTVVCNPTITSNPSNKTISSGSSTTLSVNATNATNYRWFRCGTDCTEPNSTQVQLSASKNFSTGPLTQTTQYWVRAENSCGSDDSSVATVTVTTGGGCTDVTITSEPQDKSVNSGGTTVLSVSASGTDPFTYRWYRATSPNKVNLVQTRTTSNSTDTFTTPALTANTQYWVEVTNSCPSTDNSRTATVTVTSNCVPVTIGSQSENKSVSSGGAVTLQVLPTGTPPFTYQWYEGTAPDTSTPIAGGTNFNVTLTNLTQTKNYWCRVTNECGSTDSTTITVTVTSNCVPVTIAVQPRGTTLRPGQQWVLEVFPTGTPAFSYQWYEGEKGVTSKPVSGATGFQYTVSNLSKTTKFWCRISNACGTVDSDAVEIKVEAGRRRPVKRPS